MPMAYPRALEEQPSPELLLPPSRLSAPPCFHAIFPALKATARGGGRRQTGKSPTEALVRLWLAINDVAR